jgi:hypothetical protein
MSSSPASTKPALVGEDHDLGAVARAELGENARHVRLHRRSADEELLADSLADLRTVESADDFPRQPTKSRQKIGGCLVAVGFHEFRVVTQIQNQPYAQAESDSPYATVSAPKHILPAAYGRVLATST